ncbi:two-component sensor histidine kinase [Halalkalibacter wakoensis JCM 9140]|uniref:histidine kinase n=1 Tax=Halalkalibacter wakoensis JCM 9140 TaxID=1236970 RepID=W4Q3P9_9BACI|nr:sensor histidine kinase [Halalkalibacter wakoensis]GAE26607.1 two-component sensor histidine kinase [Halalkalibacter wakoensis JCM 9140]
MIKIRTKLLIYFASILLLLILLFLVREQSNDKVMELYNENVEYFFLLNELTKTTNQTFQSLQIYVHEPLIENLQLYQEEKEQLLQLQQVFSEQEKEGISKKNVLNMITSFLEQTERTVEGVANNDIQAYSIYVQEAERTSGYIHETTLDILNMELANYQEIAAFIDNKVMNTQKMGSAIMIAIIILSILFALWFSNGITRTIERLTKAAQEISSGRYNGKDVVVSQKDELWFLTKTFNEMKRNILHSVSEIEEKAKLAQLLKEMELKSLQNQINPHFLFNTLNTISKTSYIEGAERTSDLISSVSTLLRYNIGHLGRQTTLKDEVEIIKEYFFIQKARFRDRVQFVETIDSSCLSTPIPCLTLQPIIENAFIHGIESMAEGAQIDIHIYREDGMVCIEVIDNGAGMDQETIDRLLSKEEESEFSLSKKGSGHSTGIGMRNVMDRLALFDKNSSFSVSSCVGEGTKVSIRLQQSG